jgi:6-phosphogluconolactonase
VAIQTGDWHVFTTADALITALVDDIETRLRDAITERGQFHLVLPGGRSVVPVLQELARRRISWHGVHLYMTDERCVAPGDPERNDRLVDDFLLSVIGTDGLEFHRIPAELGPDQGAAAYARQLSGLPGFDLVLLGMGEDGHTASLFGDSLEAAATDVVAVHHAPKPPMERVSLGYARLKNARARLVLAMGQGKQPILDRIRAGEVFPVVKASPDGWFVSIESYR